MKRLECLDGLRGALAVYVMINHMAPFTMLPGWVIRPWLHGGAAVDVFFMLSGLVIIQSLEHYQWHARRFLVARVARIYPVYLAILTLALAVQAVPFDFDRLPWIAAGSEAHEIWPGGWPHAWIADSLAHLTMTHGLLPDGILPNAWMSFLGSAWSLSTEWQFYLLALLLGARIGARRMAVVFLWLAAVGVVWAAAAPAAWQFSRALLLFKAQYFALGIASACLVRGTDRWRYAAVLVATLALCAAQGRLDKLLPPLLWTTCLIAQLRPDIAGLRWLARLLRAPALLRLGALSYCIYLANEPVHKVLGYGLAVVVDGNALLFTAIWIPAAILLPLLLSAGLHRWIEQPALRWGRSVAHGIDAAAVALRATPARGAG